VKAPKIAVIHSTLSGRLIRQKVTIPKEKKENICMALIEWARLW
jgi:hypothetical protein